MELYKITLKILFFIFIDSFMFIDSLVINSVDNNVIIDNNDNPDNVFNGVYSECFLHLSYACLQKKTLLYLKELNNLSEVSVIGDYVKFVKINTTALPEDEDVTDSSDELAFMIDKAVDDFFDNHVLKFNALGRDIAIPRNMEGFVGRKKRKGGGGGGGGMMGGHGGGHDDGGKKKMMMMAMMCMKMKLMMMIPAMMGMMGMMSFKGMMFSMMSFMLSKMMLLMKILEKKGGAGGIGGGGGGGGDGGWAAAGGGGGAWMPAGGQDFGGGGGGGGGGYDANGQWQSRSMAESFIETPSVHKVYKNFNDDLETMAQKRKKYVEEAIPSHTYELSNTHFNKPEISFIKPIVRYNNHIEAEVFKKPVLVYKKANVEFNYNEPLNVVDDIKSNNDDSDDKRERTKRNIDNHYNKEHITRNNPESKDIDGTRSENKMTAKLNTRQKRSILDLLQNSYMYWMSKLLGLSNNRRTTAQKYKVVNGIKYVYFPFKVRTKAPKEVQYNTVKLTDASRPVITAEDFNKGEIMEGAVESRMNKKKLNNMKDTVNDTLDDNPW